MFPTFYRDTGLLRPYGDGRRHCGGVGCTEEKEVGSTFFGFDSE